MKHHNQKQTEEERVNFVYTSTSLYVIEGSQATILEAGTGAEAMKG